MKIEELLGRLGKNCVFEVLDDTDEILISIGGGKGIPVVAAWDKNGFRPYQLDSRFRFPLEREEFIEMVLVKEPI